MATEKNSGLTSRGNVLTTELNSLANSAYTALGPEYDNSAQLDMWAIAVLLTGTFGGTPTLNAPLHLYALAAIDATNYEDGSASIRPTDDAFLGTFQVYNATNAQRLITRPFRLKPVKLKFQLFNGTGQALNASGNTVGLYTYNRTIN